MELSLEFKKLLETSDPSEINAQLVLEELYPQQVAKKTFAKPKGRGKGPRRMAGGFKFQQGDSATSPSSDVTSPTSGGGDEEENL